MFDLFRGMIADHLIRVRGSIFVSTIGAILIVMISSCAGQQDLQLTIDAQSTNVAQLELSSQDMLEQGSLTEVTQVPTELMAQSTPTMQTANAPTDEALSKPTEDQAVPAVEEQQTEQKERRCDSDKLSIIPINIEERPRDNGFKIVTIFLALVNDSPYWAAFGGANIPYIVNKYEDVYIITEDGFRYEISSWNGPSRYSIIPPGFAISGDDTESFYLRFNVADTQNQYTVEMKNVRVICYRPEISEYNVTGESHPLIRLELNNGLRDLTFPTIRPDDEFDSINRSIEIPEIGSFDFVDLSRSENGDIITLTYEFTNASQGYETRGSVQSYLIGSLGIPYYSYARFDVGPALTREVTLNFEVAPSESGFKHVVFVTLGDQHFSIRSNIIGGVYDLPNGY